MLDGDLLAYSSMAISLFSGLFLVAIHTVSYRRGGSPTESGSITLRKCIYEVGTPLLQCSGEATSFWFGKTRQFSRSGSWCYFS
jgi:hypothetical protein